MTTCESRCSSVSACARASAQRDRAHSGRSRRAVARRASRSSAAASRRVDAQLDRGSRHDRNDRDAGGRELPERRARDDGLRFRCRAASSAAIRSIVVGAPEFAVDQRVVVFLGAHGPSVPSHRSDSTRACFACSRGADNSGWIVTPPAMLPAAGASVAIVRGDAGAAAAAARRFRAARARARGRRAMKRDRCAPCCRRADRSPQPALAYLKFGVPSAAGRSR